jgi:hypothetical protein
MRPDAGEGKPTDEGGSYARAHSRIISRVAALLPLRRRAAPANTMESNILGDRDRLHVVTIQSNHTTASGSRVLSYVQVFSGLSTSSHGYDRNVQHSVGISAYIRTDKEHQAVTLTLQEYDHVKNKRSLEVLHTCRRTPGRN